MAMAAVEMVVVVETGEWMGGWARATMMAQLTSLAAAASTVAGCRVWVRQKQVRSVACAPHMSCNAQAVATSLTSRPAANRWRNVLFCSLRSL